MKPNGLFFVCFLALLITSSLAGAQCALGDNQKYLKNITYDDIRSMFTEVELNKQVLKINYVSAEQYKTIDLIFPYGEWIASFIRIDSTSLDAVTVNLEMRNFTAHSDCSAIQFSLRPQETNKWFRIEPDIDRSSGSFHTLDAFISIQSTGNLTVWTYHYYNAQNSFYESVIGKSRFCQPLYNSTCYTPSELNQTCTNEIKQQSFTRMNTAYKDVVNANFGLWSALFNASLLFIFIGAVILLPLFLVLWIKEHLLKVGRRHE